jgi:SPP1 gp7 family putative phage head morphogenesis protein
MVAAMWLQAYFRSLLDQLQERVLSLAVEDWERNPVHWSGGLAPSRQDAITSSFVRRQFGDVDLIVGEVMRPATITSALTEAGAKVNRHGLAEFKRVVGVSLTHDPGVGGALTAFRDRNVNLIKSLATRQIETLRNELLPEAELEGLRVEDLRKKIQDSFDVSKSKADLLARDQVLKLNGQITQLRQTNAGITHYTWSTSGDERVREAHRDLDGTVQAWLTPPQVSDDGRTEHPGGDYQCRCVAVPILPELLDGPVETE